METQIITRLAGKGIVALRRTKSSRANRQRGVRMNGDDRQNAVAGVVFTQPYFCSELIVFRFGSEWHMFDVYLNHKRDLLVVRQGSSIPLDRTSGKWQKRKRRVLSVSDEI